MADNQPLLAKRMVNAVLNDNSDYELACNNYLSGVKHRLYLNDTARDRARITKLAHVMEGPKKVFKALADIFEVPQSKINRNFLHRIEESLGSKQAA